MRRPQRLVIGLSAAALGAATVTGCGATRQDPAPAHSYAQPGPARTTTPAADPAVRAAGAVDTAGTTKGTSPRPTVTRTVAPSPGPATTDDGTRVLRIPAQGVTAAVFECPTRNGVVEPPPMVKDVCWWTGSRPLGANQGTSIVVGHSTRSTTSTGALERTRALPIGSVLTLAGQSWTVEGIETDVDKRGLPAWVTYATGPRTLGLITCDLTNHASNVLVRLVPA